MSVPPEASLGGLEDAAIAIMRKAAQDRLPVDAGNSAALANIVRDAWMAGERRMIAAVAEAYRLFIETDDLDAFRDTITDLMGEEGDQP